MFSVLSAVYIPITRQYQVHVKYVKGKIALFKKTEFEAFTNILYDYKAKFVMVFVYTNLKNAYNNSKCFKTNKSR